MRHISRMICIEMFANLDTGTERAALQIRTKPLYSALAGPELAAAR